MDITIINKQVALTSIIMRSIRSSTLQNLAKNLYYFYFPNVHYTVLQNDVNVNPNLYNGFPMV
jgi:hypothetical protein